MSDSGFGRLFGALFAPGRTFRSIAERPTWVWPLLVLSLLGGIGGYLIYERVDMAEMFEQAERQGLSTEQREQQEQALEMMGKYMPSVVGGSLLLFTPLFFLLVALLFWGGFRLMGAELSFRKAFSTALYGFLPSAVKGLLTVPVLLGRDTLTLEEAQGGRMLASSLAVLAPEGTGPVALALLSSVDFFSVWIVFLLVLGFENVARVKRSTALWIVLVVWGLGIGFKVASAAVGAAVGR